MKSKLLIWISISVVVFILIAIYEKTHYDELIQGLLKSQSSVEPSQETE